MQSTHNPATDEIREEMAQTRTDHWLVLKNITTGEKKDKRKLTTCLNHYHQMMNAIMRRIPMH